MKDEEEAPKTVKGFFLEQKMTFRKLFVRQIRSKITEDKQTS